MFEYDGRKYTMQDLQAEADRRGLDINDYISQMKSVGMTEIGVEVVNGKTNDVQIEERGVADVLKSYAANLGIGGVKAANDFTKIYETGEGGFLGEVLFENPFVASYGYAAEYLRDRGYDIPEEFLGTDLTTPSMRREIYENHMLDAREKGLTLEQAQKLDPTNKIKFEETLEWFNKHTYVHKDENGDPIDYLGLFEKGDYLGAADAFINDAFGAVPSLIISRLPYGSGAVVLGAGAYMDNFEREMYERGFNDETNRNQVMKDSFITGASDFTMELIGGRILNNIIGKGIPKDKAKDLLTNIPKVIAKKFGLGYLSEFTTEGLTGVMQTQSKEWSYGDVVTYKQNLRSFFKDGFLGGFLGGGATVLSTPNQQQVYDYVAPDVYKQEQASIEKKIVNLMRDSDKAEGKNKEILEAEIKELQDKKEKNKQNLYDFFNSLTKKEKQDYAENIDGKHDMLNIIGDDSNSNATQKEAKKKYKKFIDNNSRFFAGTDINYDAKLEQIIGRTLKASERIQEQKGFFGFSKKNLEIEYVSSEKRLKELEKQFEGFNKADGMFYDGGGGKNKIYINTAVASLTGQTNVLGHEYLHAIVSNAFSEGIGRSALKGSVSSFVEYLKSVDKEGMVERIENRLADHYEGRDSQGNIIRDSNGLVKTKDPAKQEEYFTLFSDIIKDEKIEAVEAKSSGIKNSFRALKRGLGFGAVDFQSGQEVFDFLVDYKVNINRASILGKLTSRGVAKVKMKGLEAKADKRFKSGTDAFVKSEKYSKEITDAVDKLGKVDKDGNNLQEKGTGNFYYQAEADDVVKQIKEKGYLDNLIAARYKADKVPKNFVSDVITALTPDIKSFKPEENNSLFGYLQGRITFRAGDVYNKIYKQKEENKGSRQAGETTKEGDVKIQVAAETTNEMKELEEKDMSIQAQAQEKADKQKVKQQKESKFRKALGIETGGILYVKVLDAARKSLLRAYSTKDTVRQIQRNLRDQANRYLFKDIKNFLGTTKYKANLKQYRENIMESLFVADLVQMEREVPEADRVFTRFVKKLTIKKEVEDAINQNLLPPSAINAYNKDKSVNLYEKAKPTEEQFLAYFMIPTINPVTGLRSGKKGTRKDTLAKNMAGALAYDATMQVAQEADVISMMENLAEARGESLAKDNVEQIAAAINRNTDVKFSQSKIDQNLVYHLEQILDNYSDKMFVIKDGRVSLKKPIKRVFGKGPSLMSQKDQDLVATLAYRIQNDGRFERPNSNNIELKKYLLRKVLKAKGRDYNINMGIAYELEVEKTFKKAFNNLFTFISGDGDIYPSINNIVYGIEVKLGIAQGVSQTVSYVKNGLNFSNKNQTKNENGELFDNIIENKISEKLSEINDFLKQFVDIELITDPNKLTDEQVQLLYPFRHLFQVEAEVDASYIQWAYANGKYKDMPQGMMVNEGGLYLMETGNGDVDGLHAAAVAEYNIGKKNKIERLELLDGKKIKVIVSLDIKNNKLKHRVRPLLLNSDFKPSKVNINDGSVALELGKAMQETSFHFSKSKNSKILNDAFMFSRSANNPTKGITVLDFDDTLATTKSLVKFTRPDGTTGTLNAEQYASTYENLLDQGYTFDFSEFNKVVKGKLAPLFQKALKLQGKFGPKNMFVLTARPPAAQKAIFDFLKANGLNIPIDNITGLGNSTAEAKALWMAEKVGEGFNDFYFADDALQNVQAVKNTLDQMDVKSKVQQARVKFSKSMNDKFNDILEDVTGIETQKRFSAIKGRKRGEDKGKFRFFIPPSHEDFVGLLYNFMGKGKEGNAHRDFLEQALVRPLNRAYRELDTAKQAIANDYKKLNEQFPDVSKKLIKNTPDGDFTFQDAIRVYLWNKHGHKIPGLTETDQAKLTKLVESDPQLQAYAETLNVISKQKDYVAPGQAWETANIRIDLVDATGRVGRAQYLSEFIENADVLFSEENLNKIEAAYGKDFREALEDMLHRIKTGVNRPKGQSGKPNKFLNWLNASVAGVMFFNTRSALLQQLSNVNYLNFADNNILAAGKAFANQKQYWADFAFILNSDMLKQRRGGIGTDVNGAELVEAIKKARPDSMFDQVAIITGKLLRLGFLPTQMGDSIAIATGGAAFYRNRVNTYLKQGLSQKEAEAKAFTDFQDITQSTQQSARPDMTSQQQASWIGKLVLNFLNTPSQYNRIIKKAGSDLKNRRITKPNTSQTQSDMSNLSRILYYGAAQNLIFYGLQTALFAVMFGDDDDESEAFLKKKERVINGSIDTILRGSGIYGVALSTIKNMMIKFAEQREKGYNKDESAVIMEALNFSPVLGIRARKIVNAEKTLNYNTKVIDEMTTFDIDNPQWSAVTNYVEGTTTLPVNRLYQKTINVRNALDNNYTAFQRAMFFSGYTTWSLDLGDTEKMKKIKDKVKSSKNKKKKKIRRGLPTR